MLKRSSLFIEAATAPAILAGSDRLAPDAQVAVECRVTKRKATLRLLTRLRPP